MTTSSIKGNTSAPHGQEAAADTMDDGYTIFPKGHETLHIVCLSPQDPGESAPSHIRLPGDIMGEY